MYVLAAVTLINHVCADKVYLCVSYIFRVKIDVLMAITRLIYSDITHTSVTYTLSVHVSSYNKTNELH